MRYRQGCDKLLSRSRAGWGEERARTGTHRDCYQDESSPLQCMVRYYISLDCHLILSKAIPLRNPSSPQQIALR